MQLHFWQVQQDASIEVGIVVDDPHLIQRSKTKLKLLEQVGVQCRKMTLADACHSFAIQSHGRRSRWLRGSSHLVQDKERHHSTSTSVCNNDTIAAHVLFVVCVSKVNIYIVEVTGIELIRPAQF